MDNIEYKKDKLDLLMREILEIIKIIDNLQVTYENYEQNTLTEEEFLDKQILMAADAKYRLLDLFKE